MEQNISKLLLFAAIVIFFIAVGCDESRNGSDTVDNETFKKDIPNIILVFSDDLGYNDLGCFSATDIKTPAIDKLAREGIKLTDFYVTSPTCTPSRGSLLTGKYPVRTGLMKPFFPESFEGMDPRLFSMGKALKAFGYSTACIGKWHLGHHEKYLPLNHGFDYYYGIPYSNDMDNVAYIEDNEIVEYNINQDSLTFRLTQKALEFIQENKNQPFFIYLAHPMPHAPVYASANFKGKSERGKYGDAVEELDWSVDEIVKLLEKLNITEKTLLIFTSDNGPWIEKGSHAGSAKPLRNGKMTTFEGGVRVPFVAKWPGKIPENFSDSSVVSILDLLPTFISLAGGTVSDSIQLDGEDISGLLLNGKPKIRNEVFLFHKTQLEAYRKNQWKLILPNKNGHNFPPHDTLLFDLKKDPGEKQNVCNRYPAVVQELSNDIQLFKRSFQNAPPVIFTTDRYTRTNSSKGLK